MGFATFETRRKLGRVNFLKDFWDVAGDVHVRYWPIFSLFSVTVPELEVLAKINQASFSLVS